ncbi:hypothetical protein [Pseudomonas indica]
MQLLLIQLRYIQQLSACWVVERNINMPDTGATAPTQTAGGWSLYGCEG